MNKASFLLRDTRDKVRLNVEEAHFQSIPSANAGRENLEVELVLTKDITARSQAFALRIRWAFLEQEMWLYSVFLNKRQTFSAIL